MKAVLVIALALFPVDPAQRLRECIENQNRQCLAAELKVFHKEGSPEYLSVASEAFLLLGRNEEAVAAISRAVNRKPGDYDLLLQQGRTLQRAGYQVRAIETFLGLTRIRRPSSDLLYSLGLSFFLAHEYERAGKHFDHSRKLDPANHKAEFMLAVIDIMQHHNVDGAKAHLERSLALQPDNPHYLLHYGVVLAQLNESEQAAAALEKAVRADPSNPLAHFNLGRLARKMDNLSKARTELEESVRLRPKLARAHFQLAAVYRSLGETEKARQALKLFQKYKEQDLDNDPVDGPPAYAFKDEPQR